VKAAAATVTGEGGGGFSIGEWLRVLNILTQASHYEL